MNLMHVYQSLIIFASGIVPSGVAVVDGESYGVRYFPPTAQNPSVAIVVEDVADKGIELGSYGSRYFVSAHITARSQRQRDALKTVLFSGFTRNSIPIYSSFSAPFVVASGAHPYTLGELEDGTISARDVLDFQSGRERLFWSANVFCGISVLD